MGQRLFPSLPAGTGLILHSLPLSLSLASGRCATVAVAVAMPSWNDGETSSGSLLSSSFEFEPDVSPFPLVRVRVFRIWDFSI